MASPSDSTSISLTGEWHASHRMRFLPRSEIELATVILPVTTWRGHLGDIRIAAEDQDTFTPWLALLTKQFQNTRRKLSFSGLVSVEFEAARDVQDVFSTLQTVGQWI